MDRDRPRTRPLPELRTDGGGFVSESLHDQFREAAERMAELVAWARPIVIAPPHEHDWSERLGHPAEPYVRCLGCGREVDL